MLDISSNGIVNVAIFYVVLHVSMTILSWVFAPIFKKFNKALALKIGIVFKFVFVVTVVLLGESILKYVYLIAVVNAFSEVLFWGGANPLQPVVVDDANLTNYVTVTKFFGKIINIVVPIIMGFCIDEIGLKAIAIAMTILVVVQFALAMIINETTEKDNRKLKYKEFLAEAKKSFPLFKQIYINQFLFGFCSNFSMIILYYTVVTFGSNVSIGIFSTIASIISLAIVSAYNFKKNIFQNYAFSSICSVLLLGSVIFILITLNRLSLTIFYFCWNAAIVVPDIITGATRLSVTKCKELERYNIENITISETFLDCGRVVGEVMLLVMGIVDNKIFTTICLAVASVVVCVYFLHTIYIGRKKEAQPRNEVTLEN